MTNKISFAIAITLIAVMIWASKARAATTVSELSAAEAQLLKATAIFQYTAQAGGTSGANSKESILSTTSLLPDVSTDITHSFPETLVLQSDAAGNLAATLGSGSTLELPIVAGYNALLIQIHNWNTWLDGVHFEGILVNSVPVRNLFAQGFSVVATDQILVKIDSSNGFILSGNITMPIHEMSGSKDRVEVWGVTVVPEPSITLLCLVSVASLFIRNRKTL